MTTTPPENGVPLVAPTDDNYIDILSAAVGAAAGVYTNIGLSKLTDTPINNVGLVLSAGAGSIIGTALHTYLFEEKIKLFLANSIVGATGAMVGCTAGLLTAAKKESTELYDVFLTGGSAALGAGAAIAVKQRLTQKPRLGIVRI